MSYAIVGAGNIGSALARQFARRGIDVSITNKRGPQSLSPLVKELGKYVTAASFADALRADVVFLAIPFPAIPDLATAGIDWNEKVVIDVTNAFGVPSETLAGRRHQGSWRVYCRARLSSKPLTIFPQGCWHLIQLKTEVSASCSYRAMTNKRARLLKSSRSSLASHLSRLAESMKVGER